MELEGLSEKCIDFLQLIGCCSEHADVQLKALIGYRVTGDGSDGDYYLTNIEMREGASHLIDVANWLEEKAAQDLEVR